VIALALLLALAPDARARQIADQLPIARTAIRELRVAASRIDEAPLRSAVEAQMLAPWLPPETWALSHAAEAEARLRKEGLLDGRLELPRERGSFAAACAGAHHAYPGGLAVHAYAELLHARGIEDAYRRAYGIELRDDWLVAAAIWHDSLAAATLPWRDDGTCGPEGRIAGIEAHHVLGIAAAMMRRLPAPVVTVIASARAPIAGEGAKQVCGWIRAAAILAHGAPPPVPCPQPGPPTPIEAYAMSSADSDVTLAATAWDWYASKTPRGWERFEALLQDGSDLAAWIRTRP
jgi:hypothetical protein